MTGPVWQRSLPIAETGSIFAVADRLVVIPQIVQKSRTKAFLFSFGGEQIDTVTIGAPPVVAARWKQELIIAGEGLAARLDVQTLGVEQWRLAPKTLGSLARSENVLAVASLGQARDSVQWFELGAKPPRRIAELSVGRDQGWSRCPYLLHALDDHRWFMVSERRVVLIDLSRGAARIEAALDLDADRVAGQAVFAAGSLFGLYARGGYWQWRDGELRQGSSVIAGGAPPQSERIEPTATLFRIDLERFVTREAVEVPAGVLSADSAGVAVVAPERIVRVTAEAVPSEVLPAPVPSSVLDGAAASPYNRSALLALRGPGPDEHVFPSARGEVLHLAWGPGVGRASSRG